MKIVYFADDFPPFSLGGGGVVAYNLAEEMVKKGQIIGLSGDTGYVTAPHLHFSIRVGTARVDPIAFIETTQKMNDSLILADISNAFLNIFNLK